MVFTFLFTQNRLLYQKSVFAKVFMRHSASVSKISCDFYNSDKLSEIRIIHLTIVRKSYIIYLQRKFFERRIYDANPYGRAKKIYTKLS